MKAFVTVLSAGLVLLGVAAWTAPRDVTPDTARRASLSTAEDAVHEFLGASGALYESGGDPRIAERVPASAELVGEMIADIAFAQHRLDRREQRQLVRAERAGSAWLPDGSAEVRTREFWIFRAGPLRGEGEAAPATSAVLGVRYDVAREAGRWRVVDYRLDAPGAGPGEGR